jgi:hypothetical protein
VVSQNHDSGNKKPNKQSPLLESATELYLPSDLRFSVKLVPTFTDRGCRLVSVTDPFSNIFTYL